MSFGARACWAAGEEEGLLSVLSCTASIAARVGSVRFDQCGPLTERPSQLRRKCTQRIFTFSPNHRVRCVHLVNNASLIVAQGDFAVLADAVAIVIDVQSPNKAAVPSLHVTTVVGQVVTLDTTSRGQVTGQVTSE